MANNVSTPLQVPSPAHFPSSTSHLGSPDHEFEIIDDLSPHHAEQNGTRVISRFGKTLTDNKEWLMSLVASAVVGLAAKLVEHLVAASSDTPTNDKAGKLSERMDRDPEEVAGREIL